MLKRLHDVGFLTDDLVRDEINGRQRKYMGVCKLPQAPSSSSINSDTDDTVNGLHRRIDIIAVPFDEWACARLYFTGRLSDDRYWQNWISIERLDE